MKTIKNIRIVCLLFFAIGFSACEKIETGKNLPKCIDKKIKEKANGCLALVTEYIYVPEKTDKIQNRIYQFDIGVPACSLAMPIPPAYYDEQCNLVDVVLIEDNDCFRCSYIEYKNSLYRMNRYVYQAYKKK
jgi:hypothetical protein